MRGELLGCFLASCSVAKLKVTELISEINEHPKFFVRNIQIIECLLFEVQFLSANNQLEYKIHCYSNVSR